MYNITSALMCPFRGGRSQCFGAGYTRAAGEHTDLPASQGRAARTSRLNPGLPSLADLQPAEISSWTIPWATRPGRLTACRNFIVDNALGYQARQTYSLPKFHRGQYPGLPSLADLRPAEISSWTIPWATRPGRPTACRIIVTAREHVALWC